MNMNTFRKLFDRMSKMRVVCLFMICYVPEYEFRSRLKIYAQIPSGPMAKILTRKFWLLLQQDCHDCIFRHILPSTLALYHIKSTSGQNMTFLQALCTAPHFADNARQQSDVCQIQFISLVPRQNCGVFSSRFLPSNSGI